MNDDSRVRAPLQLDPEAAREYGRRVVDRIVDHLTSLPDRSAVHAATRAEMERRLREPPPEHPRDPAEVLQRACDDVFGNFMCLDHPRFFGWVPGPTNFVSVMAEALAAAMNPFMGSWLVSAGPTQVELVTVDWLRRMVGLPEGAGGLFTSGGSMANLTALAVARRVKLNDDVVGARIYGSGETHSSIERALRVLGFARDAWRALPTDPGLRLDPAALERAVLADREAGLRPCCVVATAGTTNTGAIDPLDAINAICRRHDLWLHVDGAYGAPAMLVPAERERFAGIELADSVVLDPHKWLFQPYAIGCLLVRDRELLRETFSIFRDYMRDALGPDDEVNLRDHGIELTRDFRALKLWMSIQVFGLAAFREAIGHGLDLARRVEADLRARSGWEIVTPAQLALVTFRPSRDADARQVDARTVHIGRRIYEDGYAVMSSTRVEGRPVLRLCTINPRTTGAELRELVDRLDRFATEPLPRDG